MIDPRISKLDAPNTPARPRNVLYIIMDDQRFDTIAALGNPHIHTPNLDRLVRKGTAFSQATTMGGTHEAVCMPSRAVFLTGVSLFRQKAMGEVIPPETPTLPEYLRGCGYHTMHVGKWHQNRDAFHRSYDDAASVFGFAGKWYLTLGGHWNCPVHDFDPSGGYPPETAYLTGQDGEQRPVRPGEGGIHSSELFADAAISRLSAWQQEPGARGKPFFMSLGFVAPHDPRNAPQTYEDLYEPSAELPLPPNFLERHPFDNGHLDVRDEQLEAWPRRPNRIRRHLADYYAMISHADTQIGRVLDHLDAMGVSDETLIVFTSDHGLAVGQHGLMGKQNLYEHSLRIPMLLSGPGIAAGHSSDAPIQNRDCFRTLASLLGQAVPEHVEGYDWSKVCAGEEPATAPEWTYHGYRNFQRALRSKNFKYICYHVDGAPSEQLFDLRQDPWEMDNRIADPTYTRQLAEIRRLFEQARADCGDGEWATDHY